MKKLLAVFVFLVLTLIPESCLRQPPSVEDVESFMKKNWNEIVVVNDYLLGFENKDVLIYHDRFHDEDEILVDLDHQRIEDDAVMEALRSLYKAGCDGVYKSIDDTVNKNAIIYRIWRRDNGGVSCGFAYAIDHTQPPELQYQTELVALSIEGWYYYVENYEEWRYQQHRNND